MVELRLPDGDVLEVESGTVAADIVRRLSESLLRRAVCVRIDGVLHHLTSPIEKSGDFYVVTEKDEEALEVLRHSAAHIMADAVMRLFGKERVKLAIGPSIADGFYYDFELPEPLSAERLSEIEELMRQVIAEDFPFEEQRLSKEEAFRLFEELGQKFKLELLGEIEDENVTVYRHGEFVDLCRGPHIPSTGRLKHYRLLSVAGAYWRGDERNPMLVRVYGTAFFKKSQLDGYLMRLEEAKKRDHRLLGKQLDYFSVNPDIGAGLVLWHPKGARVRRIIEDFWVEEHYKRGYELVYTPHIASERTYEKSGHLEKYLDMMYAPMEVEGVGYRLK